MLAYAKVGPKAVWLSTFVIAGAASLVLARFKTGGQSGPDLAVG